MKRRSHLVAIALMLAAAVPAAQKTFGGIGVALTPAHFPRHSDADVKQMFTLGKELGSYAVFIYPWSQDDAVSVAAKVMQLSRDNGLTPIVALSPMSLGGMRSEYDAPADVRSAAGSGKLSFDNAKVREPFIARAIEFAKLKPPYLCLATEINMLAFADLKEYIRFAAVYKATYPLIKKVSPDTKVFVSFQWDIYQVFDQKEPKKLEDHSKLVDIFRPQLDLVAFTSYPSTQFAKPSDIPSTYYSDVKHHTHTSDEMMFMELGWPTSGAANASEAMQTEYIDRLPSLMGAIRPHVILWALLHDVTGVLPSPLATTGLLTGDSRKKPGFDAFKQLAGR